MPPESIPWDALTHIALASPTILSNYSAICDQSATEKHVSALARQHGVKLVWIIDEQVFPDNNRSEIVVQSQRQAFLGSIGRAAAECGIDGIDADYEGWDDPLRKDTSCTTVGSDCDWNIYTNFLNDVKSSLNAARPPGATAEKTVSACLGNWDIISWVNPKTFRGDWVSLMQYGNNYDNASVADYKNAGMRAVAAGLSKSLINIGMGTYSSGAPPILTYSSGDDDDDLSLN